MYSEKSSKKISYIALRIVHLDVRVIIVLNRSTFFRWLYLFFFFLISILRLICSTPTVFLSWSSSCRSFLYLFLYHVYPSYLCFPSCTVFQICLSIPTIFNTSMTCVSERKIKIFIDESL